MGTNQVRLPLDAELEGVESGFIRLRGGGVRAVIATSSLNYFSSPPEQQRRAVQLFSELLNSQTGPMQFYLRTARVPAGDTTEPDPAAFPAQRDYLAALTRSFIATHLADTAVYHRECFIVLAPLSPGRSLLRSWRFRFRSPEQPPVSVATDEGLPLRTRAATVIEELRGMGIRGELLDDAGLKRLIADLHPNPPAGRGPSFTHRVTGVEMEGRCYASFVIDRYPGQDIEPGWLLPLSSFPGELHVGIHVTPLDTDSMMMSLQHRIRELRAEEMAEAEAGAVGGATLGTLPDVLTVHQALARNEEKTFAVGFYLTIGAGCLAELRTQTQALQSRCRRMMLRAVHPYFQMRQGLLASWPLGLDLLGREHVLHTSALATLIPWLQEDLADADGHYWGYNKETGGMVVFDPFDERRFPNANITVLAHSGAGKSYAAASLVLSGHTRGIPAIILDPEAEYGHLVRALGGTYLNLSAGSGHAINPLDPVLFREADELRDQLNDVLDLIALMCGRLDEVERAELEALIRHVTGNRGSTPVLGDVVAALEHRHPGSRVATVLRRWVTGELGQLFSAPTNVDLEADLIGFNLRDCKEEVIAPAYFLVANWLWALLRRDRRPRHLLIDEAGLLLEHEPIRRFLVRLARRVRKYNGSLVLVSQNPGDFFETKDGAVLVANPSILLLGSHKHSEALKLQAAFSLTDRQVTYLEAAQRGDFLLLAGPNRIPVHIMAPPWMDELIVQSRGH